jgi:hypothetical protein
MKKPGDVYLSPQHSNLWHIMKMLDMGSLYYADIVGEIRRKKTDRRSAIGKTRPYYRFIVALNDGTADKTFYSFDEAWKWAHTVKVLE